MSAEKLNTEQSRKRSVLIDEAKRQPVTVGEIERFIQTESRLAFEMQALDLLKRKAVFTEHGGS